MAKAKQVNLTQKTVEWCRKVEGWEVGIVEKWVPSAISREIVNAVLRGDIPMAKACANKMKRTGDFGVRQDLFGFLDCVAMTGEGIVGIQSTSVSAMSARESKIKNERHSQAELWLRSNGRIEIWGWKKYPEARNRRFWRPKIVELEL